MFSRDEENQYIFQKFKYKIHSIVLLFKIKIAVKPFSVTLQSLFYFFILRNYASRTYSNSIVNFEHSQETTPKPIEYFGGLVMMNWDRSQKCSKTG